MHLRNLDTTLQRLEEYGLRVREDKCELLQPSVEYLRHVIDSTELHKAPSKVKAIAEAPSPKNVSQLSSFLGLLTFYAMFMPNLAKKLKQLDELLNKTKTWKRRDKCEMAFIHFDPTLILQLADASPYGVCAVVPLGGDKPIVFALRTEQSRKQFHSFIPNLYLKREGH